MTMDQLAAHLGWAHYGESWDVEGVEVGPHDRSASAWSMAYVFRFRSRKTRWGHAYSSRYCDPRSLFVALQKLIALGMEIEFHEVQ